MAPRRHDITGQRFERWLVVRFSHVGNFQRSYWLCRCDCGTERIVARSLLQEGQSRSCGCLKRDVTIALKTTHGNNRANKSTREYNSWVGLINRCKNQNQKSFKDYGGRGIKVCKKWRNSFAAFLADMGPRPVGTTLDRKNADGNYHKRNCRWATAMQQRHNRSKRK